MVIYTGVFVNTPVRPVALAHLALARNHEEMFWPCWLLAVLLLSFGGALSRPWSDRAIYVAANRGAPPWARVTIALSWAIILLSGTVLIIGMRSWISLLVLVGAYVVCGFIAGLILGPVRVRLSNHDLPVVGAVALWCAVALLIACLWNATHRETYAYPWG